MKKKLYQQGDVLITPIAKIPSGARPGPKAFVHGGREGVLLAEGEATGHAHIALEGEVMVGDQGQIYLKTPGTDVVHEEHGTVTLPAGDYTIGKVREYDHFAEEAREVAD